MDIEQLRNTLSGGGVVVGTCNFEDRNRQIGRIFANFGFDFLIIECEHGCFDLETVADMITISKLSGIVPIVKIGEYSYHTFARYLDAGADGFVLPRIRQKEEVEQVIKWINYYPDGVRGYSPGAPYCNYGYDIKNECDHTDFIAKKNKDIFIIVQFETKDAIDNADEILSVPKVDAAITGPCDLSMSLGIAGDLKNPALDEAVKKVFKACKKNNVIVGNALGDIEDVKKQLDYGLQFIWWKGDIIFLKSSQKEVSDIREVIKGYKK